MDEQNELEGVPEPGEIVVGKYRVERVLGIGGMGCVVAATHTTLEQPVAIKFLLVKAAKNPKNVMRFQREAQAAAKIKSDHVAKVSDVGTLPNGTPYMVMEYLDGEDLADRIQNQGPVGTDEAVRYILQACEALAEAHRAGIIHRDLKPANLFVATAADGTVRVKVLDFGISKIIDEKNDLTKTSALMGSPLYMSPEQMMSAKAADARADIWALGCILFELISGQPPFVGSTLPEICSRILTAPPTSLSSLVQIQPELEAVILRMLNKKPEERFQTLAEVANALYRFGGELAARSASIVCRVLDAPHLSPPSSELPTSMGDVSGQHQRVSGGPHGAFATSQNHQFANTPLPHSPHPHAPQPQQGHSQQGHSQQGHSQQGHSQQGHPHAAQSHLQSYPQGASTSQNQYPPVVAAHTAPSAGVSSGAHTMPGVAPAGMTPGHMTHAAMLQGASTGAPVAQTMSGDELPRKSRAPLFIALGALVAAIGGGALVITMAGAEPGSASQTKKESPAAPVEPEDTAAAVDAVAPDVSTTAAAAEPPDSADPKTAPGSVAPPIKPMPVVVKPQVTAPGTPDPGPPPPPIRPSPAPTSAPGRGPTKPGDSIF